MPGKNRAGYGGTSAAVPGANAQPPAATKKAKSNAAVAKKTTKGGITKQRQANKTANNLTQN